MSNQPMTTLLVTRAGLVASAAFTVAATLVTPPAHAADAKRLDPADASGFGDSSARLTVGYAAVRGSHPSNGTFTRSGVVADFDVMGFWDATRFDTLLGGELNVRLGALGEENYRAPPQGTSAQEARTGFIMRTEAAFDYALAQFGDADDLHGRVIFGAGGGFDFDANSSVYRGSSNDSGFRAYPMLLLRGQLMFDKHIGLHLSYIFLPTITGSFVQREHRIEAAFAFEHVHAGLRLIRDTGYPANTDDSLTTIASNQFNLFIGYAF
jgi:hypothetical protein